MKEITIFETKDMESNYNKNKPHVHALKKMSLRTPMTFKKYINDSLLRIISTNFENTGVLFLTSQKSIIETSCQTTILKTEVVVVQNNKFTW
jgi:hypothetical protein